MRPTTATRCGLTLLALLSVMPADAQDIRGLERVTLDARVLHPNPSCDQPMDDAFAVAVATYDGIGSFERLQVSAQVDTTCACSIWGCDSTNAEVEPGFVAAWLGQVADAGGVEAVAQIVYHCPGPGSVQLAVGDIYVGGDLAVYKADGSWSWDGRDISEIPGGGDVVIRATTDFGLAEAGSCYIRFTLTPSEGDPAPVVASALVSSEQYCLLTRVGSVEDAETLEVNTSELTCTDQTFSAGSTDLARAALDLNMTGVGTDPWSAQLRLQASGTPSGECPTAGRSLATLHLSAPIVLSSLTSSGGTLRIDGTPTAPSAFPLTLSTGQHTIEYASNSGAQVNATLSILTSDDPDSLADCNGNGFIDGCEIFSRDVADADRDWVPDSCEHARGDLNLDDIVNAADLTILLAQWGAGASIADLNADGTVNAADLTVLLARWTAGG